MATVSEYLPAESLTEQFDPKQAFLKYENLKIEEKEIKRQVDELKPLLLKAFPADLDEIPLDSGVIMRKEGKKTWEYSQGLKEQIEEVDRLKELEQQTGAAKAKAGESFLEYRLSKS